MKARPIIAFLLALLIAQATALRPASAQEESPQVESQEELKLTPEEEREVRAIAARFSERLRETNDFGQIIDEMFVKDYSERLSRVPTSQVPWVFLDKNLIAHASSAALRRFYVASMSFYDSYFRLTYMLAQQKKQSGKGEDESELAALSPEIIDVLLADPTLAVMAKELKKEYENERAQEDEGRQPAENTDSPQAAGATSETNNEGTEETDDMLGLVKNHWQLSDVTTTFEKANGLMRQRLASMPPLPPPSSGEIKSQPTPPAIDVSELDEGEYGYPKGTRIAYAQQLPFYISLVRVDGHFKILNVAIYID